jgi:hypothetical protein
VRDRQSHRNYQRHYRLRPHARYEDYKRDAAKRGRVFEITLEQFIAMTQQRCHYCDRGPEETAIGVDRVDSNRGYKLDNCVPACGPCNMAKHRQSAEKFKSWMFDVAVAVGRSFAEQFDFE